MAYLIPKSARNVKIQLFKGLGLAEVVIIIVAIIIGFVIFSYTTMSIIAKVIILLLMALITVFLVSPSFIINKKGYQTFNVLFTFFSQEKDFKKRKRGKKRG